MTAMRVMLVDDEAPFVEALMKRLVKRSLDVTPAFSGKEALERLENDDGIDVVILDVKMPVMDGIDTLREIKRNYPLVEVIMLTGHATVETAIEGMRYGAYDYLMKPCEMDTLITKVAEAGAKKATHEEKILEARMKEITVRKGV
jgi:DNA-binding NtrC family response regulator